MIRTDGDRVDYLKSVRDRISGLPMLAAHNGPAAMNDELGRARTELDCVIRSLQPHREPPLAGCEDGPDA